MSARSLNKVILIGNLTRDPEMRYTPAGTAVCTFGLATNREWVDASGQKQEGAEFHNIVAWTKLAEICSQLLFKGRKAYVSGRIQTRSWTGQDGVERNKTEIVIDEMIAFGEGKGGGQAVDESYPAVADSVAEEQVPDEVPAKKAKKIIKSKAEEVADDIPF
ncbi:single-stranded DNA-binding protein [Candidatus Collierbacteria bacterium]|nr:single-stranded DNA-binding protein [Candidatus Collierbacteria bacterium]MBI2326668.1 single-stranded DNA-binding protein [Candidatus Collierbacteria bacterium]